METLGPGEKCVIVIVSMLLYDAFVILCLYVSGSLHATLRCVFPQGPFVSEGLSGALRGQV